MAVPFVVVLLALFLLSTASGAIARGRGVVWVPRATSLNSYHGTAVRGGAMEDFDDTEESYDDDDTSIEVSSGVVGTLMDISKNVLVLVGKATIVTTKAIGRALQAGFVGEASEEDEIEELSGMARLVRTLQRMWAAALSLPEAEENETTLSKLVTKSKETESDSPIVKDKKKTMSDFGGFLSRAYQVSVDRGENPVPVLGGTIGDALREARSEARLLVAFIPADRTGSSKKITPDQVAIRSLLSPEVSNAANRRARKTEEFGSFVLWGAKASSPEAITAIKRMKAKQPGGKSEKRPFLLVAYPAQVFDSSGSPKLVPKLLAQHHCSPPPSAESMAAYLNALRKRHAKQYAAMHHDLKEARLYKERTQGYRSSVESDIQRREAEKRETEEQEAREKAELERLEALQQRREELRASLPSEPGKDIAEAMTVALRFVDGRSGQRRFLPDTPLHTVFNWVDATYEMEREVVVLTTMNGQKTFTWKENDATILRDSGLSRMTGLRVTEKKTDETTTEDATPASS